MRVGGIENYFQQLIRYSLDEGYRVIWLTSPSCEKGSGYPDVTNDPRLEKAHVLRSPFGPIYPKIILNPDDRVVMLSCEPVRYLLAECVREKSRADDFNHFLLLPHFVGSAYYPERFFNCKSLKTFWFNQFRCVAEDLCEQDCIRAFSRKHLDCYEDNYKVFIENKDEKTLRALSIPEKLSVDEIKKRAGDRAKRFRIITCARFDFPHKGYILGLIKSFARLKKKYSHIELVIVGDGPGKVDVLTEIDRLDADCKSSIELKGLLSPSELRENFRAAHLNVGLAGALTTGAQCGLPSIVMRHYTFDCEGYGFIEDSFDKRLSNDPGVDMEPILEGTITMGDEEYLDHAVSAYRVVAEGRKVDPGYLFRQNEKQGSKRLTIERFFLFRTLSFQIFILTKILKRKAY